MVSTAPTGSTAPDSTPYTKERLREQPSLRSGAANAVVAAQMALAGIQSVIPPDEIIDAMYEIGCQLPACLRETSQAGLATTPTGQKIAEKLGQNQF